MSGKGNTIAELDTGKLIRKVMFAEGVSKARLARRMERSDSSIKGSIYSSSMQCYLLWEMSIALGHNFFSDLAAQLNATTKENCTKKPPTTCTNSILNRPKWLFLNTSSAGTTPEEGIRLPTT